MAEQWSEPRDTVEVHIDDDDDEPEVSVETGDFDDVDLDIDEEDLPGDVTIPGTSVAPDAEEAEAEAPWPAHAAAEVGGGLAAQPAAEAKTPVAADEEADEEAAEDLDLDEVDAEETSDAAVADAPPKPPAAPPPPPPADGGASPGPAAQEAPAAEASPAASEALPEKQRRRRVRPWYEDFFNDDYLRTVPPPTPTEVRRQCDFIEQALGLAHGATILDVGCGLGFHTVELARRGYLVVGLDLSLPMLSRAADEAQDAEVKVNFLHADMREMSFDGAFDAVLCWGTTFGYFDEEGNRNVIERFYRALKPMGLLLLDVVNRDYVVRSQPNLVWFEGDGCVCMEETQLNPITSRLEVKRTVILDDGRQRESSYSIRLYALHELGQLLHAQGYRVAQVSGREATPGVFFGAESPRMLILAERRMTDGNGTGTAIKLPPPPPEAASGDKAEAGASNEDEAAAAPEGSTPDPSESDGASGSGGEPGDAPS